MNFFNVARPLPSKGPSISFDVQQIKEGDVHKPRRIVLSQQGIECTKGAGTLSWSEEAININAIKQGDGDRRRFTIEILRRVQFEAEDENQALRILDAFRSLRLGVSSQSPPTSNRGSSPVSSAAAAAALASSAMGGGGAGGGPASSFSSGAFPPFPAISSFSSSSPPTALSPSSVPPPAAAMAASAGGRITSPLSNNSSVASSVPSPPYNVPSSSSSVVVPGAPLPPPSSSACSSSSSSSYGSSMLPPLSSAAMALQPGLAASLNPIVPHSGMQHTTAGMMMMGASINVPGSAVSTSSPTPSTPGIMPFISSPASLSGASTPQMSSTNYSNMALPSPLSLASPSSAAGAAPPLPFQQQHAAPESLPRSVSLADFDFVKVIGEGSFGQVLLARKKINGQLVALKVLRLDDPSSSSQDITQEARILGLLDHPFLVHLDASFIQENKLYLVMDYVPGKELLSHLRAAGRFTESTARFYIAEIVCALDYMHQKSIVYRDLKPENILLDAEGHIRITDFGLSKAGITSVGGQGSGSKTATFCGTPQYLAPEILSGQCHGIAVDWWSVGVVLYEMLVGQCPFQSDNHKEMFEKTLTATLEFPVYVSKEARDLIQGLCVRKPELRLGSGPLGVGEITNHAFFKSVPWNLLRTKRWMRPPIHPHLDEELFPAGMTAASSDPSLTFPPPLPAPFAAMSMSGGATSPQHHTVDSDSGGSTTGSDNMSLDALIATKHVMQPSAAAAAASAAAASAAVPPPLPHASSSSAHIPPPSSYASYPPPPPSAAAVSGYSPTPPFSCPPPPLQAGAGYMQYASQMQQPAAGCMVLPPASSSGGRPAVVGMSAPVSYHPQPSWPSAAMAGSPPSSTASSPSAFGSTGAAGVTQAAPSSVHSYPSSSFPSSPSSAPWSHAGSASSVIPSGGADSQNDLFAATASAHAAHFAKLSRIHVASQSGCVAASDPSLASRRPPAPAAAAAAAAAPPPPPPSSVFSSMRGGAVGGAPLVPPSSMPGGIGQQQQQPHLEVSGFTPSPSSNPGVKHGSRDIIDSSLDDMLFQLQRTI